MSCDDNDLEALKRDAEKWRAYVAQARVSGKKASKPVRCVETGVVYESGKAAALATGISAQAISRCVVGRNFTSGGFHWELVAPSDKDVQRQHPR